MLIMGSLFEGLAIGFMLWLPMAFIAIIIVVLYIFTVISKYKKTEYYKITHNGFWKMRTNTGYYGEYLIYRELQQINGYHKFLFNVYVPRNSEETTEIDALLIHENGIYVMESKNYSGWIFGSEYQRQWTQTLPNGRKSQKNHFLNPIMQNELHIKWLKRQLPGFPDSVYKSIILFSDRCQLKKVSLVDEKAEVIHRKQILKTIQAYSASSDSVLSNEQIDMIYNRLYPFSQTTEEVKEKHIESIKQHHMTSDQSSNMEVVKAALESDSHYEEQTTSNNDSIMICPRCGRTLVLRTAQKGKNAGKQFWGCSGYPHCHYIREIPEVLMH